MAIHIYSKVYRELETFNQPVNINEYLMQTPYSLEKTLMLEKMEGKRRRAQQRRRWLDSITDSMEMNLNKFRETVEDRGPWHAIFHEVAESDTT